VKPKSSDSGGGFSAESYSDITVSAASYSGESSVGCSISFGWNIGICSMG